MEKEKYFPVGNEMISIPELAKSNASIMGVTFLHMGYKGMVEVRGKDAEKPFLKPFLYINGKEKAPEEITWKRILYWIPRFTAHYGNLQIEGTILPPVGERGFIISLKAIYTGDEEITAHIGLKGCWSKSIHTINESKAIHANSYVYISNWNNNLVFDLRSDINLFSFAPILEEAMETTYHCGEDCIDFQISKDMILCRGNQRTLNFYWGFGFEEVGAATSAKEMCRQGFVKELEVTKNWLKERIRTTGDERMDAVMNTNLFFNFFFASGITLDTEEFVLVTSRSPRYYVSAAYWDRDSLLWSFPSILLVDTDYAKNMLEYIFTRQIRNVGIHSRYIDGTVLEPGFELDELCAPVIALYHYVTKSKNYAFLNEVFIQKGLERILRILDSKKHPDVNLYETFLQPTDDPVVYPYLTYDNVLVWKAFKCLEEMSHFSGCMLNAKAFSQMAERVNQAIWENCVVWHKEKKIFSWSTDLNGLWNLYDEPPGSLQLMPFYGFCPDTDEVYLNTIETIRNPDYAYAFTGHRFSETGCEHAPHPWVLSIANSLLCGRKEHCRQILLNAEMDNGIACESIDENTGACTTGEAFATCAGFLAYAIYHAFNSNNLWNTEME